jgi:hypothetical protein
MVYKTHKEILAPKGTIGLSKKDIFSKYKKNHTVFFETGTHKGESIDTALELNFSKIISVEIDQNFYLNCFDKFIKEISKGKVHLFFGDSNVWMDRMLKLIDESALFWLDGHPDGISGYPLWEELNQIKNHQIKTNTIIIDDIPIYFNQNEVEQKLLEINPNYSLQYENALNESNNDVYENYRIVAYIK